MSQSLFIWSVMSSIFALLFLGWDIWQFASSRKDKDIQFKEKELHKAQVKIWQHFASGINHNISCITSAMNEKSLQNLKVEDISRILQGVQSNVFALYTSLNEERFFSEKEIKERQLAQEDHFKQLLKQPSTATSPSISQKV